MIGTIDDEDAIMIVIDRNVPWVLELAWLATFLAEPGHERAIIAREYLRLIVAAIDDEQEIPMVVEHQSTWIGEQANRELDSSIIVEKESSPSVRFDRDRHETRQPTTHHQQPTTKHQAHDEEAKEQQPPATKTRPP